MTHNQHREGCTLHNFGGWQCTFRKAVWLGSHEHLLPGFRWLDSHGIPMRLKEWMSVVGSLNLFSMGITVVWLECQLERLENGRYTDQDELGSLYLALLTSSSWLFVQLRWTAPLILCPIAMISCPNVAPESTEPRPTDWNLWSYKPKQIFPLLSGLCRVFCIPMNTNNQFKH